MSLVTPSSVKKLQTALHAKAKESPNFRFYALYDKVYRKDVLDFAYHRCKANGGAAGVDGQTFEDIEAYGEERWLDELAQELKSRTYQPLPVRRVYIPKPDGKQRPLGVPAIRDRTAETAAVLVLEPIFEPDLQPEQYAYRRDRSALDAVRRVHKLINTGHGEIVDADLSSYFDTLPHSALLKSVARRVVDGAILHLINMWLEAPVEETDERGNKHRSTRNRDEGRGTPQGAPITPLTQKVILTVWVVGSPVLGRTRRNRNAVTNGDGIVADQDVFNQQSHDFLAFNDTKRFRGAAQASKECCESFRQAQEYGTIIGLVSDRLQLSTECLLAMTQCRHTFTQLLKRQESFLIGGEKSFDTFANMGQLPLQTLLTFCGWIGSTRYCQPTIKFLVYQSRFFQQADHLSPDDLIEEFLSDEAAVIANRSA